MSNTFIPPPSNFWKILIFTDQKLFLKEWLIWDQRRSWCERANFVTICFPLLFFFFFLYSIFNNYCIILRFQYGLGTHFCVAPPSSFLYSWLIMIIIIYDILKNMGKLSIGARIIDISGRRPPDKHKKLTYKHIKRRTNKCNKECNKHNHNSM